MKKSIFFVAALALFAVSCNKGGKDPEPKIFDTITYGGQEYRTLTLSNGQTWMVDPLRYVPDGASISEDPSAGDIFYPYVLTGATVKESISYFTAAKQDSVKNVKYAASGQVATPVKDEAAIKAQGLLYSWKMILGVAPTSDYASNKLLEGVQGICPDGWHVPTEADWAELIGEGGLFYDADYNGGILEEMNKANFLYTPAGIILAGKYNTTVIDKNNSLYFPEPAVEMPRPASYPETFYKYYTRPNPVESMWKGYPAMNYIASSTATDPGVDATTQLPKEAKQMKCAMSTFTCSAFIFHEKDNTKDNQTSPRGKLNIANANFAGGAVPVRCVKDTK